ncbi:hypothetical protein BDF20DRAFT_858795 [Mycotypha africana]|uniref:uncharacterized protein n=1 Tax=Mycotypha africana TaxID=64632 RepID=UPI0023013DB4|nr:uncharacterized protein BDF20DRAFT_858795 [Mycotypha africana]KAI8984242.1 hypothetical protein BDF20DRAFT_858795 [Mycotypha africana]
MEAYAQYDPMQDYGSTAGQNGSGYSGYDQSSAAAAAAMYGMSYNNPQFLTAQYGNAGYGPAAAAASLYGAGGATADMEHSRTIYLGNVHPDTTAHDVLSQIHVGAIESYHHLPAKNCAFVTFIESTAAQLFYQQHAPSVGKPFTVNSNYLKVGWGKPNNPSLYVQTAIRAGATRNVYLGKLDSSVDTEESIRETCSQFGEIEQVRVLPEKNIAFVHFLSVQSALKCVSNLPSLPGWEDKKVNYGKDHCADMSGKYAAVAAAAGFGLPTAAAYGLNFDPYGINAAAAYGLPPSAGPMQQRTLYLGNLHEDTTVEDICNQMRGGNIVQIRHLREKRIAFITYADAATAYMIWDYYNKMGLSIKRSRVRVNFGKPSTLPPQVTRALQAGATRNVYIGGITDFEKFTLEKLKSDFAQFGDIEMVNVMVEKNCAFVNFTSVQNAMLAITGYKGNPEYSNFKVNYGKDRCGYLWKAGGGASTSGSTFANRNQEGKENQQ